MRGKKWDAEYNRIAEGIADTERKIANMSDTPDAETAWETWQQNPMYDPHDYAAFMFAFAAGRRVGAVQALTDAADAMEAQSPEGAYVVVYPGRVGGWLRDRAAAITAEATA